MIKVSAEVPTLKLNLTTPDLQKVLQEELLNTRARLIADTQHGQRADGGGLKPYSRTYKELIDSGYIFGKAPGNHTPNLTATGELMRSMVISALPNGAEMRFQGTHAPRKLVSHKRAHQKRLKGGVVNTRITSHEHVHAGLDKLSRGRSSRSSTHTNAEIARFQYEIGRSGWFTFSLKDIQRISARVRIEVARLAKSLFNRNT